MIELLLKRIQKEYMKRIPRQCYIDIIKIAKDDPRIIDIINKAYKYNKTGDWSLNEYVYKFIETNKYNRTNGHWLYYLCFIYMHPLTKIGVIADKYDKILKAEGINFRWI